jgi:hypothetical protein
MITFLATLGIIGSIVWTFSEIFDLASQGIGEFFGVVLGILILISIFS